MCLWWHFLARQAPGWLPDRAGSLVNIRDNKLEHTIRAEACFLAPVAFSSVKYLLSGKIYESREQRREKHCTQRHLSICSSSAAGKNSWKRATFSAEKKKNCCVEHHINAQPTPLGSVWPQWTPRRNHQHHNREDKRPRLKAVHPRNESSPLSRWVKSA